MEIHLRTVVVDCEDGRRAANFYSMLPVSYTHLTLPTIRLV